jgi:hypothetical protein
MVDYSRMLGIWKPRLFERRVEPVSADSKAWVDGHVLSNEEVERIARSLIEDAPRDESQLRDEAADTANSRRPTEPRDFVTKS